MPQDIFIPRSYYTTETNLIENQYENESTEIIDSFKKLKNKIEIYPQQIRSLFRISLTILEELKKNQMPIEELRTNMSKFQSELDNGIKQYEMIQATKDRTFAEKNDFKFLNKEIDRPFNLDSPSYLNQSVNWFCNKNETTQKICQSVKSVFPFEPIPFGIYPISRPNGSIIYYVDEVRNIPTHASYMPIETNLSLSPLNMITHHAKEQGVKTIHIQCLSANESVENLLKSSEAFTCIGESSAEKKSSIFVGTLD